MLKWTEYHLEGLFLSSQPLFAWPIVIVHLFLHPFTPVSLATMFLLCTKPTEQAFCVIIGLKTLSQTTCQEAGQRSQSKSQLGFAWNRNLRAGVEAQWVECLSQVYKALG